MQGAWWNLEPLENLRIDDSFGSDVTYDDIDQHVNAIYDNASGTVGTIGPIPGVPSNSGEDYTGTTDPGTPNTNTFTLGITTQELKSYMLIGVEPYNYAHASGFGGVGSPKFVDGYAVWDIQINLPEQYGFSSYEVRISG